jgi:AraC-like DNA-binding protein
VPIGTLAYDCGFTTQAHFSRRFKDRYGVTPREYRVAAALKAKGIVSDP